MSALLRVTSLYFALLRFNSSSGPALRAGRKSQPCTSEPGLGENRRDDGRLDPGTWPALPLGDPPRRCECWGVLILFSFFFPTNGRAWRRTDEWPGRPCRPPATSRKHEKTNTHSLAFSRSTRFTHLRTAPNSKYSQKFVKLFRIFCSNFWKHFLFRQFSSKFTPILMIFSRDFG